MGGWREQGKVSQVALLVPAIILTVHRRRYSTRDISNLVGWLAY